MRRVCLFSFYDAQGLVDDYVVFFLKALSPFVERTLFYSNGPLAPGAELKLADCVREIIVRPNEGFDVIAYKQGLERIGFDADGAYDEVLMVNHTCYGPLFPFAELFGAMETRTCDFWGVTAHMAMNPNPLTGSGTLAYHINTNFLAVRGDMVRSRVFHDYWQKLQAQPTYEKAILSHEAVFTEHFAKLGFAHATYLDCEKYGSHYPAILSIDETLIDRNPLLKRRAFFHDPRFLEHYAADLPRALRILHETSDYDPSLIWRNVTRSAELRTLNTNAGLTSVLPDERIKRDAALPACGRLAVCAHIYYTEMLDEILALTDTIPLPFDLVATTNTIEKKQEIESRVRGRGQIAQAIVRVVEQNRGRDMSSLFITCRDLFLDGPYALVCRLHTKKSPHVETGRGNLFKRHMFENLLNSAGYTTNVLDMFSDNPWIGVAIPPAMHMSFGLLGHAWLANRGNVEALMKQLHIEAPLDPDTPIAPYGGMYWFRPQALRKLFAHEWRWSDFSDEPALLDGSLSHALERILCYVAQDARFTTQQIMSERSAGWNYAMLEYKLQKLGASLPNADFNYQTHILASWKQSGFPVVMNSQTMSLQPTMRQALRSLLHATKGVMAERSPTMLKIARPIYRFARNLSGPSDSSRG